MKSLMTFFDRWRGREGELFGLSTSIKTLTLLFRGDAPQSNLVLACIYPFRIEANSRWKESNMTVELIDLPGEGVCFRLIDVDAGLCVVCDRVEAFENRKLW
ncbi:MAG: hypothetical protein ABJE95_03065 [Byssovorax sp.]